jgi:dolichol-phosphate mannosyltransferase
LSDSIVIIPTYNEKENIANIIKAVFSLEVPFDVLVIDDGSPDGTAGIVRQLMAAFPGRLHLEQRPGKQGLGTAYIKGFRWALSKGYAHVIEMDADFSHNPFDLPRLRQVCVEGADMSIGSRYTKGGKVENWPFDRVFISYGASLYVRLVTWMPIKDPTAGFVCYTSKVLRAIDLDKITFVGYAFQIQMKFAAYQLGFKLREVPITFTDRVAGVSKMSMNIVHEAIKGVLLMRWRSFFGGYGKNSPAN